MRSAAAVALAVCAGALCAAPVALVGFVLSLRFPALRPLPLAASLPVFCLSSLMAAPFAAPTNKERQVRYSAIPAVCGLALAGCQSLPRVWCRAALTASALAVLLALTRSFRDRPELVSLRKPPTKKGL